MPYRRLPNTDAGRIRAIKKVLDQLNLTPEVAQLPGISRALLQNELDKFERLKRYYDESLRTQVAANLKFQLLSKNARIYISHFIQVLNLAVVRQEIRKEAKLLYGLEINSNVVPELNTNESIVGWGGQIIAGENLRKMQGGAPIYNTSIARVNVAVSQFKEACFSQKKYQETTYAHLAKLKTKRESIDNMIQEVWNKIEAKFSDRESGERFKICQAWGVVYYLRKNEKEQKNNENN